MTDYRKFILFHLAIYAIYAIAEGIWYPYSFELKGDVLDYWTDAEDINKPFHPFHVPLYPAILALLNWITLDSVCSLILMRATSLFSWVVGAIYFNKILTKHFLFSNQSAFWGTILFSLWPMVALVYTYFPIADSFAICLYLIGTFYLLEQKVPLAFLFIGLTLVAHKFFWPLSAVSLLLWFALHYRKVNVKLLLSGLILIAPLAMLYTAGFLYYGSPTWIVDTNLEHEFAAKHTTWPIFKVVQEELLSGFNLSGFLKSAIVLVVIIVSSVLLFKGFKASSKRKLIFLAGIPLTLLIFSLVLNSNEIWAVARFSRLLALPLFAYWTSTSTGFWKRKQLLYFLVLLFIVSNMAYGYYVSHFLKEFNG